ncbi:MAG: hypothetical protein KDH90_07665, partial [Anaerolineae bacterium]|nr:hypothetical protein [Anaerolineae bacterium]
MQIDPLIEAILQVWSSLPRVFDDRWPAWQIALAAFLIRYDDAADLEARSRVVIELEDWLDQSAPDLLAYLEAHMEAVQKGLAYRGIYSDTISLIRESVAGVQATPATASTVTRYTDITCPRRVWVIYGRIAVTVGLTVDPSQFSAAVEELRLRESLPVQVRIA